MWSIRCALVLAFLTPVIRIFFMGISADWGVWIYRALTDDEAFEYFQ